MNNTSEVPFDPAQKTELQMILRCNLGSYYDKLNLDDEENLKAYLTKQANEGCGYAMLVNALAEYYIETGYDDFQEKFGYSFYNKDGYINYECMLLDLYSFYNNKGTHLPVNLNDEFISKSDWENGNWESRLADYFDAHGLNMNVDVCGNFIPVAEYKDWTERMVKEGVTTFGYSLMPRIKIEALTKNGTWQDPGPLGGHYVTQSDLKDSDGYFYVSSWGLKCRIPQSELFFGMARVRPIAMSITEK